MQAFFCIKNTDSFRSRMIKNAAGLFDVITDIVGVDNVIRV